MTQAVSGQAMGGISLPLALLGVQAMLGVVVVDAQYNVYYGYTAQELQEFISDTVMLIFCFNSLQCFHPRRQAWWWRRWLECGLLKEGDS